MACFNTLLLFLLLLNNLVVTSCIIILVLAGIRYQIFFQAPGHQFLHLPNVIPVKLTNKDA